MSHKIILVLYPIWIGTALTFAGIFLQAWMMWHLYSPITTWWLDRGGATVTLTIIWAGAASWSLWNALRAYLFGEG